MADSVSRLIVDPTAKRAIPASTDAPARAVPPDVSANGTTGRAAPAAKATKLDMQPPRRAETGQIGFSLGERLGGGAVVTANWRSRPPGLRQLPGGA